MRRAPSRGFTLVEVLVALTVVAIGLTALMVAVSGTARTSSYLRDKTIAQWIALNRLTQVRLTVNKLGDTGDTGELDFANRKWHYDTRYFDTSFPTMKRVVVRVYPGASKTKGNPIAESTGFLGSSLGIPGTSNVDWAQGSGLQGGVPCPPNGPSNGPGTPLVGGGVPNTNCTPGLPAQGVPSQGIPPPSTPLGGPTPQSPTYP